MRRLTVTPAAVAPSSTVRDRSQLILVPVMHQPTPGILLCCAVCVHVVHCPP